LQIKDLTKAEIIKMAGIRCKHGHSMLDHPGCYERDGAPRLGFFDIEASNLDADYGQLLSYCIKDGNSEEIFWGCITKEDIFTSPPGQADKRIVEQCIEDFKKFTKIVTFYGARFDMPYIRTRALANGLEFPPYGALFHRDIWFTVRGKCKLSSNRLENACRVLLGKTSKTRIEPKHWHGALQGDEKSLNYVLAHNKFDVIDLEKLYNKVEGFGRAVNNSI